jgi:hypothetical protein
MASVPETLRRNRAAVPPVVLPITSRGIAVTDRLCWGILGAAMAVAAVLILYLNRGTTFYLDELALVYDSPGLTLGDVLEPYNGHLTIVPKLVFKGVLETFGADYLVFRLLHVGMLLVTVALFYVLAKRRIGALPALAPAFVLLFFGSAYLHVVIPIGLGIFICISAGLGALLAVERGDLRGDLAACGLVAVAVATFSTGLAFLVGIAVSVLLRRDRWRRAWIFLIPLALYAVWWLATQDSPTSVQDEGHTKLSNILLIPAYAADSLAAVTANLAGLNFDFDAPAGELGWGRLLAVATFAALIVRLRRGNLPASFWVSLAIVLSFWSLGALVTNFLQAPGAGRYIFMGAVGVLLVATDAARSVRFSKLGLVALFAACAVSLSTNIFLLRDGALAFRNNYSLGARSQFAMLELARGHVDPDFDPEIATPDASPFAFVGARAGTYFTVVDRYGSLAMPLSELARQPESVRENADLILIKALDLRLDRSSAGQSGKSCRTIRSDDPSGVVSFELPAGGASMSARSATPATLTLGRFGSPSENVGSLIPRRTSTLTIPPDSASTPWRASIAGARSVTVCPPP